MYLDFTGSTTKEMGLVSGCFVRWELGPGPDVEGRDEGEELGNVSV